MHQVIYNAKPVKIKKYKGFKITEISYKEDFYNSEIKTLFRVVKMHTKYNHVDFNSEKEAEKFIDNYENIKEGSLIYLKKINQIEKLIARLTTEKEDLIKLIDPNFLKLRG